MARRTMQFPSPPPGIMGRSVIGPKTFNEYTLNGIGQAEIDITDVNGFLAQGAVQIASSATVFNFDSSTTPRWISVRLFDVQGDGIADDTDGVTEAIEAAILANVPVYFPAGVYLVTTIQIIDMEGDLTVIMDQGAIIKGANTGTIDDVVHFDGLHPGASASPTFDPLPLPTLRWYGGTIDYSERFFISGGLSSSGLSWDRLRDVHISDVTFTAGYDYLSGHGDSGIAYTASPNVNIESCKFFGANDAAIYPAGQGSHTNDPNLVGNHSLRVSNCYFYRCHAVCTVKRYLRRTIFTDNSIMECYVGLALSSAMTPPDPFQAETAEDFICTGNTFGNIQTRAVDIQNASFGGIIANNVFRDWCHSPDGTPDAANWPAIILHGCTGVICCNNDFAWDRRTPPAGNHVMSIRNHTQVDLAGSPYLSSRNYVYNNKIHGTVANPQPCGFFVDSEGPEIIIDNFLFHVTLPLTFGGVNTPVFGVVTSAGRLMTDRSNQSVGSVNAVGASMLPSGGIVAVRDDGSTPYRSVRHGSQGPLYHGYYSSLGAALIPIILAGGAGYGVSQTFDVTVAGGTPITLPGGVAGATTVINVSSDATGVVTTVNSITIAGQYDTTGLPVSPNAPTGGTGAGLSLNLRTYAKEFASTAVVTLDGFSDGARVSCALTGAHLILNPGASGTLKINTLAQLPNYADNTAAVTASLASNTFYRNGNVLQLQTGGTEPAKLPSFAKASLPSAATYEAALIWVTNDTGGKTPAYSDGTNWRRVEDRAVIS